MTRYTIIDCINFSNAEFEYLRVQENSSSILNIFRIISGTVNIKDNFRNRIYKLRENHIKFPTENNRSLRLQALLAHFDESITLPDLNHYFEQAKKNRKFYNSIEVELIKCIIAYKEKKFLESFFYLYRIIEGISYSIPLIYISKKTDYNKTYHDLQAYFGKDKDGEISFFKRFVSETFKDEDFFKSNIVIDINEIDIEEVKSKYFEIYLKLLSERVVIDKSENDFIQVKFIGYYDFIIELRNRFFHNLKGSWQENFDSTELMYPDLFFKPIISHGVNWMALILFEIIKFDFSKIR